MWRLGGLRKSVFNTKENGELYQYFGKYGNEGIEYKDFSACKKIQNIKNYLNELLNYHFNLTKPPLYKFILVKQKEGDYILVLVLHHIIMDGTYANKFIKSISYYYNNFPRINPDKNDNYTNYLLAYLNLEKKLEYERLKENSFSYWSALFRDKSLKLNLPYSRAVKNRTNTSDFIFSNLGKNLSQKIKTLSNSKKISVFILMSAAWSYLLHRYTQNQNILLTYPVNMRLGEFFELQGCFVNSVPLIASISENETFISLVEKLSFQRRKSKQYQQCTFPDLISCLRKNKIIESYNGTMFNISIAETVLRLVPLYLQGVSIECIPTQNLAGAEISLEYSNNLENIPFQINYKSDLFHKEFIRNMIKNFKGLLNQSLSHPYKELRNFSILTKEEYQKIVYDWNQTEAPYPKDKTIHQLFKEQAENTPDNIAVVFEDKQLTYRELNEKVNKLAHCIRNEYKEHYGEEVKGDTLIGLYIERSLEMIVGILGILKAGAAYVPFDSADPEERLKFKISDSACKMILTSTQFVESLLFLSETDTLPLSIDGYWQEISKFPKTNPTNINKSTDLAYVIYTSGSTGKSKGVMIEHRSVVNLLSSLSGIYDYKEGMNKSTIFTSYVFDVSVSEIFVPLLKGKELHILSDVLKKSPKDLGKYIETERINYLYLPPSLLAMFPKKAYPQLRTIVYAGEPCDKNTGAYWAKKKRLFNIYGPTETTIYAVGKQILNEEIEQIGRPINNTKCYILNSDLLPVSVFIIGELYIGGDGLARGYLNRPELTVERFIPNPFATEEDKRKEKNLRLYKTGDLCRYLPDGNIEFIGRNDNQVKIRGFRTELGEIENILSRYKGVNQAVVVAKEKEGNKYLVGYYTEKIINDRQQTVEKEELRKYLESKLPDYMIPSLLIGLEKMPLNTSGKIDYKELPNPEFDGDETSYVMPTTEMEKQLCNIWQNVLDIKKIGIRDNFFNIGGNSILAIQVTHKMSKILKKQLHVVDLFKYKTIENIINKLVEKKDIRISKFEGLYPCLSFSQERLYFLDRYEGGTNAYNIPICLEIKEKTNIDRLKDSLQKIVCRHEILRTVYSQNEEGDYYQKILNSKLKIEEVAVTEANFSRILNKDVNGIFKLEKEIPIKVWIYNSVSKNRKILLINIHHIAFDGWSTDLFFKELNDIYNDQVISELSIQYKDFAVSQREYMSGAELTRQLAYWKEKLKDYENLNLPTDKIRPIKMGYAGDDYIFTIKEELSIKLRELAKELGVTLYTILFTGFNILLSKYSNQEDIVIGTPIANRHLPGIENLIGFFVNSLALHNRIKGSLTIKEAISSIYQNLIEAQGHQDLPFEKLVEELKIKKNTSRHPLFQIMFGVQNFSGSVNNNLFIPFPLDCYKIAKFDLSLFVDDGQDELNCCINYAMSLFNKNTIMRIAKHYECVLRQLIKDIELKISAIEFLSKDEYQTIIYDWNRTEASYPKNKTIHQLFEEQVKRTPDNIAVVFEDKQLTYLELNEKANQLAHCIRNEYKEHYGEEVKGDTLIGLYIERSLEMIIGILGILKAGSAYVPLDAADPEERLKFKINDCGCKMVLTSSSYVESLLLLAESDTLLLAIDLYRENLEKAPNTNPKLINRSINLAYVIYTSGSTGQPKGVMVEHKSAVNLISNQLRTFNFSNTEKVLLFSSICFDASIEQIFLGLLSGSTVYIISSFLRSDPINLHKYIVREKLTHIHLTPSYLNLLGKISSKYLRRVIAGAEVCNTDIAKQYSDYCFINEYGPTETTITSVQFFYDSKKANYLPIGRPIQNTSLYILDANLQPMLIGITGELYIGGDGVARGYLNNPELTTEVFVPNPFITKKNRKQGKNLRLYKTGDLARWLPNGNIEYVGRNDSQVKIRGFRVELGEIEAKLLEHPAINQAVVVVQTTDNRQTSLFARQATYKEPATVNSLLISKYLIAYYTLQTSPMAVQTVDKNELRTYLALKLPDYMIPAYLVKLEKMPLNVSGKIDKQALPEPELTSKDSQAPITELEMKLGNIWQEVLRIQKIGITDDFFRIGGDSILSIQLSSRMCKEGFTCSVKDIFEYRTIAQLCNLLELKQPQVKIQSEQGILEGEADLLPIQGWFFEKIKSGKIKNINHWNQSFIVKVSELDVEKLKATIPKLVEQHDMLRVFYARKRDKYLQKYNVKIKVPGLKVLDIRRISNSEKLRKVLTKWQSNFDIEKGPLWQIGYIHGYTDGTARIYFALHHIIVDAVSWKILIDDLRALYDGEMLSSKGTSYRQWVKIVQNYALNNKEEKKYWLGVQYDQQDYTKYAKNELQVTGLQLNKKITHELISQANQAYNTEINDLLLTALGYALYHWNQSTINHITLEGHGREHIQEDIDLSKTIGWFTTVYPVRLEIKQNLNQTIKHIKENLRAIPNKGVGYGVFKQNIQEPSFKNLPLISFNYLGQFDSQDGLWQVVHEDSGISIVSENLDSNLINIDGMIVEDVLRFDITSRINNEKTQEFVKELEKQLKQITRHCVEKIKKKQIEYTQSDFKEYEPYLTVNYNNSSPIFIFPPGSGGAESYFNNLVPFLSKKYLVLFNNFYLYMLKKFGEPMIYNYTYEQLASEYITIIKKIQPKGPYVLLGWSFGGVLAFEVARQLCLKGELVKKIVLICSFFEKKNVIKELSNNFYLPTMELDINDTYCPRNVTFSDETTIVLYKATQPIGDDMPTVDIMNKRNRWDLIFEYYAKATDDNHISKVLKYPKVNIIPINASHFSWIQNVNIIKQIANECD